MKDNRAPGAFRGDVDDANNVPRLCFQKTGLATSFGP
jgi:hypothetical protein